MATKYPIIKQSIFKNFLQTISANNEDTGQKFSTEIYDHTLIL